MRTYLLKRVLQIPVTLLGITIVSFLVMSFAPGDPSANLRAQASGGSLQSTEANREALENWRAERHLDKPMYTQYLYWLNDLAHFDLGKSLDTGRQKVWDLIKDKLPITIIINFIAFAFAYLIAIPIGVICGARQNSKWDRFLTVIVFLLYSLPSFWIGTLMLAWICPPFPTSGYHGKEIADIGFLSWTWTWTTHLFLPVACSTYASFAFLSRQMRSSLLEQIRQDFIRTARSKGLSERVVILRHATRNALIPIITLFGNLLPALIAGSVIIEYIFSIPGMGQLFIASVFSRDYTLTMGIIVISSILTLIGFLISDILYVIVNPRIAYD